MSEFNNLSSLDVARAHIEAGEIAEAILALEDLIGRGDAEAMYLRSQIGQPDESESDFWARAIALLEEAVKRHHPGAMYELGALLEAGDVLAKDESRAEGLFERASALGHPHAMWRVSLLRFHGKSATSQDLRDGRELLERAAKMKCQGALRTLADFYHDGAFGYPQDEVRAAALRVQAESDGVLLL